MRLKDLSQGMVVAEVGTARGDCVVLDNRRWINGSARPTLYGPGRYRSSSAGVPVILTGTGGLPTDVVQKTVEQIQWTGDPTTDQEIMKSFLERHEYRMHVLMPQMIITIEKRNEAAAAAARKRAARQEQYQRNCDRVDTVNEAVMALTGDTIVGRNMNDDPETVDVTIRLDTLQALLDKIGEKTP